MLKVLTVHAGRLAAEWLYRVSLVSVAVIVWCSIPSIEAGWQHGGLVEALLRFGMVVARIVGDLARSAIS